MCLPLEPEGEKLLRARNEMPQGSGRMRGGMKAGTAEELARDALSRTRVSEFILKIQLSTLRQ